MLRGHRDLKVYQLAYKLAMEIFHLTKTFPREELYSLTDRPAAFLPTPLRDFENGVIRICLSASLLILTEKRLRPRSGSISLSIAVTYPKNRDLLTSGYEEVGKMLSAMIANPERSIH